MAQSRTERIGTIFSRITSLVKAGAVQENALPVWYDVYKAFPPTNEPCFSRPISQKQIRNIFYEEDKIRKKFQENASLPIMSLNAQDISPTQKFLIIYKDLLQSGNSEEKTYSEALKHYKSTNIKPKSTKAIETKNTA